MEQDVRLIEAKDAYFSTGTVILPAGVQHDIPAHGSVAWRMDELSVDSIKIAVDKGSFVPVFQGRSAQFLSAPIKGHISLLNDTGGDVTYELSHGNVVMTDDRVNFGAGITVATVGSITAPIKVEIPDVFDTPAKVACPDIDATQVLAANANRLSWSIKFPASASGTVYVHSADGLGVDDGWPLDPGESYGEYGNFAVWVRNDTGVAVNVHVVATERT